MERIIVVGPSGAGKTTLARSLATAAACPHIEMDALWWQEGWTEAGPDSFREQAAAALAGDRWVADGNYFSNGAAEVVWPRADTIVWLDLSRAVTISRLLRRSTVRALRRTELWNGNRETFGEMFGEDSLLTFAWRNYPNYRRRYEQLVDDPALPHLAWHRLRTPGEVRRWLRATTAP